MIKRPPIDRRRRPSDSYCKKSPTKAHRYILGKDALHTVPGECKYCQRRRRFPIPKRLPIYSTMGQEVNSDRTN